MDADSQLKRPAEDVPSAKRIKSDDYTCRVCFSAAARYVCPKCLLKTCSVVCNNQHKIADACSGKKDRTEFKQKAALGESELRSDLAFLTDVSEVVESTARLDGQIALNSGFASSALQHPVSPALSRAVRMAIAKSLVVFRQSPACAERRRRNTTCIRRKKFRWRVEWVIGERTVVTKAQPPDVLLRTMKAAVLPENADAYAVLMADESVPSNQRGFVVFDECYSLSACLAGLLVVDFPTLLVVPKAELGPPVAEYVVDINQLPSWAATVANARIGVVGSYKGRPVYDKQYPEEEMVHIGEIAPDPVAEQYSAAAEPPEPLVVVLPSEGEEDVDL